MWSDILREMDAGEIFLGKNKGRKLLDCCTADYWMYLFFISDHDTTLLRVGQELGKQVKAHHVGLSVWVNMRVCER